MVGTIVALSPSCTPWKVISVAVLAVIDAGAIDTEGARFMCLASAKNLTSIQSRNPSEMSDPSRKTIIRR